jgi:hypothetical protein
MIKLQDAAVVTWPAGKNKPKTTHLTNLTGAGALTGAFWGLSIWYSLFHFFGWSSRRSCVRCGSWFNETYRDRGRFYGIYPSK